MSLIRNINSHVKAKSLHLLKVNKSGASQLRNKGEITKVAHATRVANKIRAKIK
jgi:hypothetical protein